jgi:Pentapeptide repeats (9 copies)
MDLTLNPTSKRITGVVVLHLDSLGYGPEGKFSRKAWRDACLDNFNAGSEHFELWQKSWLTEEEKHNETADFDLQLHFEDGSIGYENQAFRARQRSTLDFAGIVFENRCHATKFKFLHHAYFSFATFHRHVEFFNTEFNKHTEFNNARFAWGGQFAGAKFHEAVIFSRASFEGDTQFVSAVFNGNARFDSVHFAGTTQFQYSAFNDKLLFQGSIFDRETWFENVIFTGSAGFQGVKFNNIAWFKDSKFVQEAWFYKAIFTSQCQFENTNFGSEASFENAVFENVGHFENARFLTEFPSFLGVNNATTRLEFSDDDYFNKDDVTEDAIKRLGQLKRLADEHGQTEQALMFNAFELNAKRSQSRLKIKSLSKLQKLVNADFWFANATAAYSIFSDFGRSFTKPLKFYIILLIAVFLLALGCAGYYSPLDCKKENLRVLSDLWRDDTPCDINASKPDDKTRINGYRAAAEYTVYRAAGILDFSDNGKATDAVARRLFGQSYEPGWMRFVGLIKAVTSTALLFLAALGLRNKYRIK